MKHFLRSKQYLISLVFTYLARFFPFSANRHAAKIIGNRRAHLLPQHMRPFPGIAKYEMGVPRA